MVEKLKQRFHTPFVQLEFSFAIRNFALGLISLFIPIYLLERGFTVRQVTLYFMVYLEMAAIGSIVTGFVSQIIKFKHLMVLHYPLFLGILVCLYAIDVNFVHLILVGAAQGLTASLYWLGHHLKFRIFSNHEHRGLDTGIDRSVREIAKSLAPVFGGLIIGLISAEALFILAGIIYLFAVIPLLKVPHITVQLEPKYLFTLSDKLDRRQFKFWFIYGWVEAALLFTWPLFIYLFIAKEYEIIGLLAGLSLIILVIENFFTGDSYDKGKRYLIWLGGLGSSIVFMGMFLAQTIMHAVGINIFKQFVVNMYTVPLIAELFNDSEESPHLLDYFIKQEFFINTSKVVSLSAILIVPSINYIFLVTALLIFAFLVVGSKKRAWWGRVTIDL
jgi:hypothetical protein